MGPTSLRRCFPNHSKNLYLYRELVERAREGGETGRRTVLRTNSHFSVTVRTPAASSEPAGIRCPFVDSCKGEAIQDKHLHFRKIVRGRTSSPPPSQRPALPLPLTAPTSLSIHIIQQHSTNTRMSTSCVLLMLYPALEHSLHSQKGTAKVLISQKYRFYGRKRHSKTRKYENKKLLKILP